MCPLYRGLRRYHGICKVGEMRSTVHNSGPNLLKCESPGYTTLLNSKIPLLQLPIAPPAMRHKCANRVSPKDICNCFLAGQCGASNAVSTVQSRCSHTRQRTGWRPREANRRAVRASSLPCSAQPLRFAHYCLSARPLCQSKRKRRSASAHVFAQQGRLGHL
jgi:hypothetical protein